MWITAATLHLEGNGAKWHQAYKQRNTFKSWTQFCEIVEEKFGSDDFRAAMNDLLQLKQIGSWKNIQHNSKPYNLILPCMMHPMMISSSLPNMSWD